MNALPPGTRLCWALILLIVTGVLLWELWGSGNLLLAGLAVVAVFFARHYAARHATTVSQETVGAVTALADIMEDRDVYTYRHSLRVGQQAERLAAALGLPHAECRLIYLCGRLHDIGKCAVSNDVLHKPGPLNASEREEMARHAAVGAQMLERFHQFRRGSTYVRGHHEWYDGSGYPDGLARSQIPLGARIIAVADAYDAMTTNRPYRRALAHDEAVRRLVAGSGSQWDPIVIQQFLRLIGEATSARESARRSAQPVLTRAPSPA